MATKIIILCEIFVDHSMDGYESSFDELSRVRNLNFLVDNLENDEWILWCRISKYVSSASRLQQHLKPKLSRRWHLQPGWSGLEQSGFIWNLWTGSSTTSTSFWTYSSVSQLWMYEPRAPTFRRGQRLFWVWRGTTPITFIIIFSWCCHKQTNSCRGLESKLVRENSFTLRLTLKKDLLSHQSVCSMRTLLLFPIKIIVRRVQKTIQFNARRGKGGWNIDMFLQKHLSDGRWTVATT